jgi:hypothetical protein
VSRASARPCLRRMSPPNKPVQPTPFGVRSPRFQAPLTGSFSRLRPRGGQGAPGRPRALRPAPQAVARPACLADHGPASSGHRRPVVWPGVAGHVGMRPDVEAVIAADVLTISPDYSRIR